jgi:hypothetical protein
MNWKAEVFADIVGALLTGANFFDSSLTIFVDEQYADEVALLPQDRTHPYPILRPLIALETLEWLAQNQPGALTKSSIARVGNLRQEWQRRLDDALNSQQAQAQALSTELREMSNSSSKRPENEANKQRLEERICKVRNAVAQTGPIVEMFLTEKLWLDVDGRTCPLNNLFTYVEAEEDNQGPRGKVGKPVKEPQSASFQKMSTFVRELVNKQQVNEREKSMEEQEEAAYRALIDMPLVEERGNTSCKRVVHVGPGLGNYNYVANTCGPDQYLVREDLYPNGEYVLSG